MSRLATTTAHSILAAGVWLLFSLSPAEASGFAVPESSALGLGTANAVVANPRETGAFPYNPAAMGFHDRSSIAAGALLIGPDLSVASPDGSHHSADSGWSVTPLLQGAVKLNERWRLGLGVTIPFGLETQWELGTFPILSQSVPIAPGVALPAGLDHPTQTRLEILAVVPTLAYKVNDKASIAAGIDYYSAIASTLDTQVIGLDGDGDGWGWNLSALYADGSWSFGGAYRAAATVSIDGHATTSDPILISGFGVPRRQGAKVDMNLPWRLQLGLRYAFSDRLAVEFDWSRTGWSEFDKLVVKSTATGAVVSSATNAWKDASAYRIGLTYDLLPMTQLRFGYAFDETGQPDGNFSPRIPDNDRQLFSVGVGQEFPQGWALEAAYTYVSVKDRKYLGDKPYVPTADVNGTFGVNGDYEASAHVFAVELIKTF